MGVVDVERLEDGKLDDIDIPVMSSDYHLVASDEKGTRHVTISIDGTQVLSQASVFELWFVVLLVRFIIILRIVGLGYLFALAAVIALF